MTKYIIAYKKIDGDKWYKFAIVSRQGQIGAKIDELYQLIHNIEKIVEYAHKHFILVGLYAERLFHEDDLVYIKMILKNLTFFSPFDII